MSGICKGIKSDMERLNSEALSVRNDEILRNNNCAITDFSKVLAVRNDQIKELKAENIQLRGLFIEHYSEVERLKKLVELTELELLVKKAAVINLTRKLKRLEK